MTYIRGQLLDETTGDPVAPATPVEIRLVSDDSLLDTPVTDADGYYEADFREGNPGPLYTVATIGGTTRKDSSRLLIPTGSVDLSAIRYAQQAWVPGVIYTFPGKMNGEGLRVTANGTNMLITVGTGASVAYGVMHTHVDPITFTVDAAPVSGTRTDTVIVRHYYEAANEGKTLVIYVPDNNSYENDPNQTVGWRDVHLATITVDAGVTAIATNKVTDRRTYANPQIGDGYILPHMLASGLGFPLLHEVNLIDISFGEHVISTASETTVVTGSVVLPIGSWSGKLHFELSSRWTGTSITIVSQHGATTSERLYTNVSGYSPSTLMAHDFITLTNATGTSTATLKITNPNAAVIPDSVIGARIYATLTRTL